MNELNEVIKIAEIHAMRIKEAISETEKLFPLTAEDVADLTKTEVLWLEMLVNRFSKLQDLIGSKIITEFLFISGESIDGLTVIDKLNLLEKLDVIEDTSTWQEMRKARNHVAHEYPDSPELTAKHLNNLFQLVPELIKIFDALKTRLNK